MRKMEVMMMTELDRKLGTLYSVIKNIESRDPVGASAVRWLARMVKESKCANCHSAYERGYSAGYRTGKKEAPRDI